MSAPGYAQYHAYQAKYSIPPDYQGISLNCFKLEVEQKDIVTLEESATVYKDADIMEEATMKSNLEFKKYQLESPTKLPTEEIVEATSASPDDELLRLALSIFMFR
jgi:hypothetical protein